LAVLCFGFDWHVGNSFPKALEYFQRLWRYSLCHWRGWPKRGLGPITNRTLICSWVPLGGLLGAWLGAANPPRKHSFCHTKYQPGRLHLPARCEGFDFEMRSRHQKSKLQSGQRPLVGMPKHVSPKYTMIWMTWGHQFGFASILASKA
jgi:hypothetical protein